MGENAGRDIPSGDPATKYVWRVHHPFQAVAGRAAVEISPRRGLITRWRFVVPEHYHDAAEWGVGPPGGGPVNSHVRDRVEGGPSPLVGGPVVVWFGGGNPLSTRLSAYFVFDGEPPHYLAFGEADEPSGPPLRLEGISFGDGHPEHPALAPTGASE